MDHALRDTLAPDALRSVATAIRYNQIHAVAALAVALSGRDGVWISLGGWGFVAGAALFSGGIYLATLLEAPALLALTPIGGVTLMLAWLALAIAGVVGRPKRDR